MNVGKLSTGTAQVHHIVLDQKLKFNTSKGHNVRVKESKLPSAPTSSSSAPTPASNPVAAPLQVTNHVTSDPVAPQRFVTSDPPAPVPAVTKFVTNDPPAAFVPIGRHVSSDPVDFLA